MYSQVARLDAYMHVQTKDEIGTGSFLHFVHDLEITGMIGDQMVLPVRERVRSRRADSEAQFVGLLSYRSAQFGHFPACFGRIIADMRTHFNHGLVHFGLYLVLVYFLCAVDD